MLRRILCGSQFLRFALVLAVLVGAVWVRRWWKKRPVFVAPIATTPIFYDEFNGTAPNPVTRGRLDPLKWNVTGPEQILQRTQWGKSPLFLRDDDGTSYARLELETFNPRPEKPGRFHLSTQITSHLRWKVENGVEYEARLRANRLPPGLILGFFAYGDAGVWKNTYQKTETDFELLTLKGGENVWTHIWDNWNPLRLGADAGSLHPTGGANWNSGEWNVFKIRWYPDRTEWILNNRLLRTEKKVRPGSPMGVWFNLWAPNPDWLDAYDPAVQAARTPRHNRKYALDVDYVRVRRIPAPPRGGAEPSEIGRGEGLQGNYFSTPNLKGPAQVRLDPRVDFDWGVFPPAPRVVKDHFSVRWEGFVEARRSETYTFWVRSDDGGRLWVDGQQLINHWRVQGPALRSGTISLRAGQKVPIRLEIFKRKGNSVARLMWSSASRLREIVPQSQLYVAARPAAPHFSPGSRSLQRPLDVTIKSATPNATIRYTLDGHLPTLSSRLLPPGRPLRVKYTALVRAAAFVEGQVPSEITRAFYVLDDKTAPRLSIVAPAPDLTTSQINEISGVVEDGGSGVKRVDVVITRLRDGFRWKEGRWVADEWGMGAQIRGSRWIVGPGLPGKDALLPGKYEIKAVAYDVAGNIKGASQLLFIARKTAGISVRPKNRQ